MCSEGAAPAMTPARAQQPTGLGLGRTGKRRLARTQSNSVEGVEAEAEALTLALAETVVGRRVGEEEEEEEEQGKEQDEEDGEREHKRGEPNGKRALNLDSPSTPDRSCSPEPRGADSGEKSRDSWFLKQAHGQGQSDVSIAQSGLQRIRREAQSAHVSLRNIVEMFGSSLANMATANDAQILANGYGCAHPIEAFHGTTVPRITVRDYLFRIVRSLNTHDHALFATDGSDLGELPAVDSGEHSAMGRGLRCLLLALVYIDRACSRYPYAFRVTSRSVHRIVLAAIYVATKFTDDAMPRVHQTFAKLGGVSCRELRRLEGVFCSVVDFRFYVTEAEFQALCMEQLRLAVRNLRHVQEAKLKLAKSANAPALSESAIAEPANASAASSSMTSVTSNNDEVENNKDNEMDQKNKDNKDNMHMNANNENATATATVTATATATAPASAAEGGALH